MTLDEDTLFGLRIPSFEHAIRRIRCLRDLSMTLASANTFNGASFDSLARYFRVSPTAMAIRLEELDLVTWMPEREAEPSFW